jgi:hypothetical protein
MRGVSSIVVAIVAVSACKGATPTKPSGVTFAYVAPSNSGSGQCNGNNAYIGDVALDPQGSNGYAAILPYLPSSCNNGGGGNGPVGSMYIESFALDGSTPAGMNMMPIGSAQTQTDEDFVPRVAATNSGPVWIAGQMQGGDLLYGPPPTGIVFNTQPGALNPVAIMVLDPLGVVAVGGSGQNQSGIADIDSPEFPCCGGSGMREPVLASIGPVAAGSGSGDITVSTGASIDVVQSLEKNRVVSDGSNFYYLSIDSSNSSSYDIMEVQLDTASPPTKLATIGAHFANPIPAGLALAGNDLVVSLAPNVFANNQSGEGCALWHYDMTTMQAAEVLETTNFTCLDTALDGELYFVIADAENNCTGCSGQLRGIGVGRVALTSSTPNTLLLGIDVSDPGPRRVYLANGNMYVVDPFVVASISEDALDGAEDVRP